MLKIEPKQQDQTFVLMNRINHYNLMHYSQPYKGNQFSVSIYTLQDKLI